MIKFRAWDKVTRIMNEVTRIDFEHERVFYYHWKYGFSNGIRLGSVELLQSTGLKDKNGVEIFEGDVVKTKYGEHGRHIGVVKYGGAKFYSNGVKQYLSWHEDLNGLFEIIGNKFEHPHLLEGDTE